MKKINILIFSIFNLSSLQAIAEIQPDTINTDNFFIETKKNELKQIESKSYKNNKTTDYSLAQMSEDEFIQNQVLSQSALVIAIQTNNIDNIKLLLPLYQQTKNPDSFIIKLAETKIQIEDKQIPEAIDSYKSILAQWPEATFIRFNLAELLLINNQIDAAEDQFKKVKSDQTLNDDSKELINQYLKQVQNRKQMGFNFNMTMINDKNINSAPKIENYNGWEPERPQKAYGIRFKLNAFKSYNIVDNYYFRLNSNVQAKLFPNHKRYNDIIASVESGIAYKDFDSEYIISPIFTKRWFNNKPYSSSHGLSTSASNKIGSSTYLNHYLEFSKVEHDDRTWLNGNSSALSSSIFYFQNPTLYYWFAAGLNHKTARFDDDAYHRYSLNAGVAKEWSKGISTEWSVSNALTKYKGEDIFGIKRKDKDLSTTLSIWKRTFTVAGLTPKINANFEKTISNHPMYNQNEKIYISISLGKSF